MNALGGKLLNALGGKLLNALGGKLLNALGGKLLNALGGKLLNAVEGKLLNALGCSPLNSVGADLHLMSNTITPVQLIAPRLLNPTVALDRIFADLLKFFLTNDRWDVTCENLH